MLKLGSRSFVSHAAVLALLIAGAFWIYRLGVASYPRSDQNHFMLERMYYDNDWQFFQNALAYNRTRHHQHHDDFFFFRPGTHAVLGLVDIFFRPNLYIVGVLSILWHVTVTFLLYLFLYCFAEGKWRRVIAFLGSCVFLTQYGGLEMVFWRHVSPYMIGMACYGAGMLFISRLSGGPKETGAKAAAFVLFFLSSLFHETLLIALFLSGAIFFLKAWGKQTDSSPGETAVWGAAAKVCFLAFAVNLSVNLVSLLFIRSDLPPSFVLFTRLAAIFNPLELVRILIYVSGVFFSVFLFPQMVRLKMIDLKSDQGYLGPSALAKWDFSGYPSAIFYAAGVLFVLILILFFVYALSRRRGETKGEIRAASVMAAVYLGTQIFSLTVVRVIPMKEGAVWLYDTTYNYYVGNFLLLLVLAALIRFGIPMQVWAKPSFKIGGHFLFLVFVAAQVSGSYSGIQNSLRSRSSFDFQVANLTLAISRTVQRGKEYCYGGAISKFVARRVPLVLLFRDSCFVKGGTPLYTVDFGSKGIWLASINSASESEAGLRKGSLGSDGHLEFPSEPADPGVFFWENKMAVTKDSYRPTLLSVKIHRPNLMGLIAGFEDKKNFVSFVLNKKVEQLFYVQVMKQGKPSDALFPGFFYYDKKKQSVTLTVRQIGVYYVVFWG